MKAAAAGRRRAVPRGARYKRYQATDAERQQQAKINEEKGIKPPEQGPELLVKPDPDGTARTTAKAAAFNPNLSSNHLTARTNGKVFFTLNGANFQCSGTVVNSEGKDTVWTAGHCVNAGQTNGAWATNWTFVPAYDDDLANPRPYGTWSARQLWTKTAWKNSADFAEDMGVAIMNTQQRPAHRQRARRPRLPRQHRQERLRERVRLPGRVPVRRRQPVALLGHVLPGVELPVLELRHDQDPVRHEPAARPAARWLNGYDGNSATSTASTAASTSIVGPTDHALAVLRRLGGVPIQHHALPLGIVALLLAGCGSKLSAAAPRGAVQAGLDRGPHAAADGRGRRAAVRQRPQGRRARDALDGHRHRHLPAPSPARSAGPGSSP